MLAPIIFLNQPSPSSSATFSPTLLQQGAGHLHHLARLVVIFALTVKLFV